MGTISYSIPQDGQPFSTEGPKVDTALTTLLTLVNGNLDSNNLAAAGVTAANLAPGAGFLTPATSAVDVNMSAGQYMTITVGGKTATLPSGTAGQLVAVQAGGSITAASPATVTGPASSLIGPGWVTVTSITLGTPGASVVLISDGTYWRCVAGGEDTGWLALSLGGSVATGDPGITPSIRRVNGQVFYWGTLKASGSISALATLATIPSGYRPSSDSSLTTGVINNSTHAWGGQVIATHGAGAGNGIVSTIGLSTGDLIPLNGCSYSLS